MNKKSSFFILILSLFLLTNSCQNGYEYSYLIPETENPTSETGGNNTSAGTGGTGGNSATNEPQAPVKKYATLNGSLGLSGAYPQTVRDDIEDNTILNKNGNPEDADPARSARPSLPTGSEYYVRATATNHEPVDGVVNQTNRTFQVGPLELGVTWSIEAGIKGRYSNAEEVRVLMNDVIPDLTLTEESASYEHNFLLRPLSTGGNGEINLSMTVPNTVTSASAVCISDDEETIDYWNSLSPTVAVNGTTASLNLPAIKSGSYDIILYFYGDSTDFPVYTTVQSVNVFENMKTNTWADTGNTGVISGGSFEITPAILTQFSVTNIYVGNPGTYGEGLTGERPDDDNTGGPYSPLETLNGAIALIKAQKIADNSYTIHICGQHTGHFELDSGLIKNGTDANATKITIVGQPVTGDDGTTISPVLNGGGDGRVLKVSTGVPVEIKNLSITNGNAADGAGLYVSAGANVTIAEGASIAGNHASANGGGVYVAATGTVNMSAGSISANTAVNGGAVYNAGDFNISANASIPYGTANDVFLPDGKTLTIAGNIASGSQPVATITPEYWTRGNAVLDAASDTMIANNAGRFATIDSDFHINQSSLSGQLNTGILNADIYVASAGSTDAARHKCVASDSFPSSEARGTGARPFATVAQAADVMTNSNLDYTIIIDGNVLGAQEIPSTVQAKTISLQGYIDTANGATTSDAVLNGNQEGSTLTLQAAKVHTIENLKITGGDTSPTALTNVNGGGINVTDMNTALNLGNGVVIQGNTASNGGGVYIPHGAGLCMYGNALIGDSTVLNPSSSSTTNTSINTATSGGGLYCAGSLYLGYKYDSTGAAQTSSSTELTGGIYGNYASSSGGGIYLNGTASAPFPTAQFTTGVIKCNGAGTSGGGVFVGYNASLDITDSATVSFDKNKAFVTTSDANGGAIFLAGSARYLDIQGGTFTANEAESNGGAICANSNNIRLSRAANLYTASNTEKVNDICLLGTSYVAITGNLSQDNVATITPENWTRGTKVITASSQSLRDNNLSKFTFTDTDFEVKPKTVSSDYQGYIYAPIIVKTTSVAVADQIGTASKPYSTIKKAVNDAVTAEFNEVTVVGTVYGAQEVSGSIASDFTIKGQDATATLSLSTNTSDEGHVLVVGATGITVTIKDLKITGGNASNTSIGGGGICINSGSVCLSDGAIIKGNRSKSNGGGVYVGAGGKLFMCGSSVIGDVANSTGLPSYANTAIPVGNEAKLNGGAIYNNGGEVLIGYDATGYAASVTSNYGIRKNYSVAMGAAIYNASGKIQINSVDISYNLAGTHGGGLYVSSLGDGSTLGAVRMSDNKATQDGGAIYIATGKTLEVSGSAIFTKNTAKNGGAIYNAGTFSLGAGRIGGTTSANTASTYKNTASTGLGGAIYNKGTLYLNASSICFYGGAVNENDIYLDGTNKVTLKGSPTSHSETNPIYLTMPADGWTRGKQVLAKTTDLSAIDSTVVAKFRTIDDDFTVMAKDAATGVLKAPIYVAGTGHSSLRQDPPSSESDQRGSSSKPFSTIASAAAVTGTGCTEIIVDGTLSAAQTIETCGSNTITLSGYKVSNTATSTASLTGNTTYGNTMLTVNNSSLTLTITDLTIKNGWNSNGGGIAINAGTVKLGDKVKVTGNIGTNGGGVYVKAGAILFVYGSARIGDEGAGIATSSSTTDNSTTGCSNKAAKGGGIYNAGTTYIGYSAAGGSTVTTIGGVYRNYANSIGGGIYNPGVLIFGNGYIKYNATDNQGGAVYNEGSFTLAASANIAGGGGMKQNDIGLLYDSSTGDFSYLTVDSTYTGTNAVITPTQWKRGKKVVDGTYDKCALFSTTDSDFTITHTSTDYGNLSAPIIVATNNSSPYIAQTTRGTTSDPYKTISDAVTNAVDSSNKKITIKGTVPAQSISSWPTTGGAASVAELTIEGADVNATINGGGTSSALAINTAKTFNISSLKITNGKAASGGGIYIQSEGTVVNLDSGAKVYSNKATTSGGGVYVASSAKLIIKTGAAIYSNTPYNNGNIQGGGVYNDGGTINMIGGSIYSNEAGASGDGGGVYNKTSSYFYMSGASNIYDNSAAVGGGIFNVGTLNLGPSATDSTATLTGAIYQNIATTTDDYYGGGGIYTEGPLTMTSGTIGGSAFNSNTAIAGGGIYSKGIVKISGGTISYNEATTTDSTLVSSAKGGGLCLRGHGSIVHTISGGEISNNTTVGNGNGIFSTNTISVKSDAQIDSSNDVYLSGSTIKIVGNDLSKPTVAKITPSSWTRGTEVISASSDSYITAANLGRFVVSDSDWSIKSYTKTVSSTDYTCGVLTADVYVTSTAATDSNRATGISAAPATAADRRGTKAAPFATITEAAAECNWDTYSTKTQDFVIKVSGTVNVSETQSIPSTITNAKSITIEGVNGSSKDVINRGLTAAPSSGGSVLSVYTNVPITITKLKITGGYAKYDGGGIIMNGTNKPKLTLDEDTVITGNTATREGGGVYFTGPARAFGSSENDGTFIMKSGSKVENNNANDGGGVCLRNAHLCMAGTAIIGKTTSTNDYATDATNNHSNYASSKGGGIYCAEGGTVWLGYASPSDSDTSSLTGGVIYNYAANTGGGIYCIYENATVKMASGYISKNATPTTGRAYLGGAIAIVEGSNSDTGGGTFIMKGGTMSYNAAGCGGGIYVSAQTVQATIDLSGTATISNNSCSSSSVGGGMYIASYDVNIKMGGDVSISSATNEVTDNIIYIDAPLNANPKIKLTSNLTTTNKIHIQYRSPKAGAIVLEDAGGTIANNYKKFEVLPASNSLWAITNTGTLQKTGISVTAANATSKIADLTTGMTLQITTQPTTGQYGDIRDALRSLSGVSGITLDLSTIDSLSLTGPSSTTGVFANCNCLKVVVLGYGLTEIGANAFSACSNLEEVTIPASVTKIGACAFKNCNSLSRAYFMEPVEWKVDGTSLNPGNLTNAGTAADCLTIDYVNSLWTK